MRHFWSTLFANLPLRWKLLLTGLLCALLAGLSGVTGIWSLNRIHLAMGETTGEISRSIGDHNSKAKLIAKFRKLISAIQNARELEALDAALLELMALTTSPVSASEQSNDDLFLFFSEAATELILQHHNLLVSRIDIQEKWATNNLALEAIHNLSLLIMDNLEFESSLRIAAIAPRKGGGDTTTTGGAELHTIVTNSLDYLKTSSVIHLNMSKLTALMHEMSGLNDIDYFRYRNSEIHTLLNNTINDLNELPRSDEVLEVSKLLVAFSTTSDEVMESQARILVLEEEYQETVKRIYRKIDEFEPQILRMTEAMKAHAEQALQASSLLVVKFQKLELFFVLLAIALAIAIAVTLSRSVVRQLGALNAGIEIVGRGDLSHKVDTGTGDEIGTLSRVFDQMAANIRHSQQQLAKALEEAKSANKAKSEFLANMSHELRTPLNAILGFTQIMERSPELAPEYREDVQIISRSGEHLLNLINDVLNLAKIEAGRATLVNEVFDLRLLLRGIRDMFSAQAGNKQLQFTMEIDAKAPRYVLGDPGKIRQIIINIVGNALKFTNEGAVHLSLETEMSADPEDRGAPRLALHFVVKDTGVGISREKLPTIFAPFVQAGRSKDATAGTGLGLTLCQKYLQLMDGTISVESELGAGSSFFFTIPVSPADGGEPSLVQAERRVVGLAPGQREYKILIVEDHPINRNLLRRILQPKGFTVLEAENGKEGVEMFIRHRPDFIWMDMQMPVMDGYEATTIIKQSEEGRKTPVYALTASALEEQRQEILEHGCDGFVRKPFDPEDLFKAMAQHLGVTYLYTETPETTAGLDETEPELPTLGDQALQQIPGRLLAELAEAALALDHARCRLLIDQVRGIDPRAAEAFQRYADNFQFEKIHGCIQEVSAVHDLR